MAARGLPAMPGWVAVPEHEDLQPGQLILTTYKVNVHTHSRTMNCRWLAELYHANPAWLNPETAAALAVADGDTVRVASDVGSIETRVRVTPGVVPGVIAISHHCGHWQYGRFASGKPAPGAAEHVPDRDRRWWQDNGVHPNWVIPNSPDPINGQQRWMDTVVRVSRVDRA